MGLPLSHCYSLKHAHRALCGGDIQKAICEAEWKTQELGLRPFWMPIHHPLSCRRELLSPWPIHLAWTRHMTEDKHVTITETRKDSIVTMVKVKDQTLTNVLII